MHGKLLPGAAALALKFPNLRLEDALLEVSICLPEPPALERRQPHGGRQCSRLSKERPAERGAREQG